MPARRTRPNSSFASSGSLLYSLANFITLSFPYAFAHLKAPSPNAHLPSSIENCKNDLYNSPRLFRVESNYTHSRLIEDDEFRAKYITELLPRLNAFIVRFWFTSCAALRRSLSGCLTASGLCLASSHDVKPAGHTSPFCCYAG